MRLKSILFFNISIFLFSVASVLVAVANNDPTSSRPEVFVYFYGSFFVACWSAITLLIFFIKSRFNNQILLGAYLPTLRQAMFASLSLTIILFLQGIKIFDWWVGISIIISLILLELFFESKDNKLT